MAHEHGKMDITTQEKTFEGFVSFLMRGAVVCIAILLFMAIFNA